MGGLPWAGRLVAWGNAYLAGSVTLADARREVDLGIDSVVGDDRYPAGWPDWLTSLTTSDLGTYGWLRLALPVPGDPAGLVGPPATTTAALLAGQAAMAATSALLPEPTQYGPTNDRGLLVRWTSHERWEGPPPAVGVSEADHALTRTIVTGAEQIAALDVTTWRPPESDRDSLLPSRSAPPRLLLPQTYPRRAQLLASKALQIREIVAGARRDQGGSLTALAVDDRAVVLARLDAAARQGLVAACQALAESASTSLRE